MAIDPSKFILLVEDNPDDVFIFKMSLKAAEITHPMTVVTNGREAIDYLKASAGGAGVEGSPLPFLMFLDLKMPYMDGFEVLSWMRSQPSLQPETVVVLSGSDESKDHHRAQALGARNYLLKPPSPEDLRELFRGRSST